MRIAILFLFACSASVACSDSGSAESSTTIGTGGPLDCISVPKTLDPDAIARAAVVLGSCGPDDRPTGYASSLYEARVEAKRRDRCLLNAVPCLASHGGGCDAVVDCLATEIDLLGPCAPACNGTVAVGCDDQLRFRQDCAKWGATCSAGECEDSAPATPACSHSSFQSRCDNGAPVICSGDFEESGPRCADYQGLECADTGYGVMACVGTGSQCQPAMTNSMNIIVDDGLACVGTSLDACVNGKRHVLDCNALMPGLTCQTVSGEQPPAFCGIASECVPEAEYWKETCDGDSVVFCNAGRIEKVDCKSLGFSGCLAGKGVCVPSPWGG